MNLQRGTYCRERDGATLLYHSSLTTWNDPSYALMNFLRDRDHSSMHSWRAVQDPGEQAALRLHLDADLRPGEYAEVLS